MKKLIFTLLTLASCIDDGNTSEQCKPLTIPPARPVISPVSLGIGTVTVTSADYQAAQVYMFAMDSWAARVIVHEHCLGE